MKHFLLSVLFALIVLITNIFVYGITKNTVYNRCMKYSGYAGYPANWYCKLYVGDIKARDEE